MLPPHVYDGISDPALPALNFVKAGDCANLKTVMCSAFAFGGANAVLVLEKI